MDMGRSLFVHSSYEIRVQCDGIEGGQVGRKRLTEKGSYHILIYTNRV